ncbi:Ada metal-binding domain-containing protein [Sinomicrobium weinanense]|uniref:Metal-binding protein n=1 Tax=Sinomicrobium weinanense TaxID=2842200 RepID=A0A926JTH8_9FLAO|nr:Ada metal-binding domain-containing protein [Sinomicrobium weinanense]MBC9797210.1 metal-binding protein [Sinomicrobium weinanense]MBU3122726.1 metal-binding protein [Sinomicrobium weinanense]
MTPHQNISDSRLKAEIRNGNICLGGNHKLKIYGKLRCSSGKRMKRENRVFFSSEEEARSNGYRPCGHCMPEAYRTWKYGISQKR